MTTLYQLAKAAEPGDRIRWVGKKSDVEDPEPREVRRVILEPNEVTVEADGPGGAPSRFWVRKDGDSEVRFGRNERPMGPVDWAELVDKDLFVST